MDDIHDEFAGIPVDKVSGHTAFIYQHFYTLVLVKALGLDQNTATLNETCIQINQINNHAISDHTTIMKNYFSLEVGE